MSRRILVVASLVVGLAAPAWPEEDPVLRARAQRAETQGASEGDLPPVPRGIVEPPPLPPPEAHVKDSRKKRSARRKKGQKAKVARKAPSTPRKAPAKAKGR